MNPDHQHLLNITHYCLQANAQKFPDKYALIIVDAIGKERKFTYQELYHHTACLATGLKSLRLPKGSVVAIQAQDTYDLLLSFLAVIAADLVPVILLMSLVEDGINYILNHSHARLFMQLHEKKNVIQLRSDCLNITLNDYQDLKNFSFEEIQPATLFNDPAFILYTSGSTGNPKGVVHAQRAILGRKPSLKYWLNLNESDIVMQTDNLCWTYSLFTGFLDPLMVGATALVYNPSNASSLAENTITGATWLQLIEHYKITVMASTPDIYHTILNVKNIQDYNLSSLRIAGSAGTLLPDSIQNRWQTLFEKPIYTALGMTEISTFISNGPLIPPRAQTIGKIQPGRKVSILPVENGVATVACGETGMLAVHKGELGLMLGYLGENAKTNVNFRGDWFLTQDLVSMDKEEYLTYYGRFDSILKVDGGFRVSPVQVENVIKSYSHIKDAACGAVFDDSLQTDVLAAYIVCDQADQTMAGNICQHIKQHLSDYKIPSHLFFVDHIPYTIRGKVNRGKLKETNVLYKYSVLEK